MTKALLTAKDIAAHVEELAGRAASRIDNDWVIVALMDGAMMFAADFLRALYGHGLNPVFETLCLSSYGEGHQSSGDVKCLKDINADLTGRSVLILDDIFESGQSLDYAKRYILAKGAAKAESCVLVYKDIGRRVGELPEYIGWQAPKSFLIGYGLDDAKRYRGQPFISAIKD